MLVVDAGEPVGYRTNLVCVGRTATRPDGAETHVKPQYPVKSHVCFNTEGIGTHPNPFCDKRFSGLIPNREVPRNPEGPRDEKYVEGLVANWRFVLTTARVVATLIAY